MTALTAVAAVSTLACLITLAAACVLYLRQPITPPGTSPRSYSEQEIQQHAQLMLAQIERYLSRRQS